MALYGLFMVSYGILWSFLAVIDPNSFGLVVIIVVVCVESKAENFPNGTKNVQENK